MSDWKIGKPGRGGGEFDKAAHEGHLLLFVNAEEQRDVQTKFGLSDAALCAYVCCIDDGMVLKNFPVFGTALVPRIIEGATESEIVAGRLGRGTASGTKSAAWLLFDASDEDEALGEKWLDAHAVRMPSGRIEIEAPAPRTASEEPF